LCPISLLSKIDLFSQFILSFHREVSTSWLTRLIEGASIPFAAILGCFQLEKNSNRCRLAHWRWENTRAICLFGGLQ